MAAPALPVGGIYDFFSREVRGLRPARRGEWHGVCPFCGGRDRFLVSERVGRWRCRQCSPDEHWYSVADYIMRRDGVSYRDARDRLSDALPASSPPVTIAPKPTAEQQAAWKAAATACAIDLSQSPDIFGYLERVRGLRWATQDHFGLGLCRPEGGRAVEGVWVQQGITIPLTGVDGTLYGIKVRRNGKPKYIQVSGSQQTLYGHLARADKLLLVEGEFDAMLAWQEVGREVAVATAGSASASASRWLFSLTPYTRIVVVQDADQAGRASTTWAALADRSMVVTPPYGKDLTDFHRQGGSVREWVMPLFEPRAARAAVRYTPPPDDPEPPNAARAGLGGEDSMAFGRIDWDEQFPPVPF